MMPLTGRRRQARQGQAGLICDATHGEEQEVLTFDHWRRRGRSRETHKIPLDKIPRTQSPSQAVLNPVVTSLTSLKSPAVARGADRTLLVAIRLSLDGVFLLLI